MVEIGKSPGQRNRIMNLVKKLENIGMVDGGVANIFLDVSHQVELIRQYGIDLDKHRVTDTRCVLFANNGRRVFSSPVLGFSESSEMSGMSLQVGIFCLIYFRHLIPLLPKPIDNHANKFHLSLYPVPLQTFDMSSLARAYNIERIFTEFSKMRGEYRETQHDFLTEYDRIKSVARKAARQLSRNGDTGSEIPAHNSQSEIPGTIYL